MVGGLPGDMSGCKIDGVYTFFKLVISHGGTGGIEGIGFDDIGTRFKILFMYLQDDIRAGKAKQVIASFQVACMLCERRAPEVGFGKPVALYHGSHGTIQHQQALCQFFPYIWF